VWVQGNLWVAMLDTKPVKLFHRCCAGRQVPHGQGTAGKISDGASQELLGIRPSGSFDLGQVSLIGFPYSRLHLEECGRFASFLD
jgi:hypothetical protein